MSGSRSKRVRRVFKAEVRCGMADLRKAFAETPFKVRAVLAGLEVRAPYHDEYLGKMHAS